MGGKRNNPIDDLIFKGRRCTGCGSTKVAAVSCPKEVAQALPFAASRLGAACWCAKCFLLLIAERKGEG